MDSSAGRAEPERIGCGATLQRVSEAAPDRSTNRLAGETSAYLRQHMHNPVDWHPWGEPALERARREGKPLLVSIGYSA